MSPARRPVVLLSGGVDSTAAFRVVRHEILTIDLGAFGGSALTADIPVPKGRALDYSGYPDCRPEYIAAFERMAALATRASVEGARPLRIHTPLIAMTKAEIVRCGLALGVDYGLTLSCYDPAPDARPCRRCDACVLRRKGFEEAGITDPAA